MEQFLRYWKEDQQDRRQQITGDEMKKEEERRILYLKDWHYAKYVSFCSVPVLVQVTFHDVHECTHT